MENALTLEPSRIRGFLYDSLSEILETLTYTVACEELPLAALADCGAITAEISFRGAREGTVAVTASLTVAQRLARSLSGLGPEELLERHDELIEDAMRETANMAAGVLLRRLAVGAEDFRLGLPRIVHGSPTPGQTQERVGICVAVDTVEGPVGAELEMRVSAGQALA